VQTARKHASAANFKAGFSRFAHQKRRRRSEENENGCDIGYALVASPCEGANNVDACTVTAYDVITTFAVQQC